MQDKPRTPRSTRLWLAGSVAAIALAGVACGTAAGSTSDTTNTTSATTTMAHDMSTMNMGDPTAVPAYEVDGAELDHGTFAPLPGTTRPVTGDAWLARHDGTTVSIELAGLEPGAEHIAHVHVAACSEAGGDHFRFDADGAAVPPNEIHLAFTATADGTGSMTVENPMVAPDDARSIVVHIASDGAPKLACADLAPHE
jgi:hypothetical protein